jgi:hypothetical protein
MHKFQANSELDAVIQSLKGYTWLLEKSNHSGNGSHYPHHVRDRLSESMILDISETIASIDRLKTEIERGLDNEGDWNGVPF